jgi:hypothetical protein
MRTIESMKQEAKLHGGAIERVHGEHGYGMKVAVTYESSTRIYLWTVDDSVTSETTARKRLQDMADILKGGSAWA